MLLESQQPSKGRKSRETGDACLQGLGEYYPGRSRRGKLGAVPLQPPGWTTPGAAAGSMAVVEEGREGKPEGLQGR